MGELRCKFYSDTNLDGFMDAMSIRSIDYKLVGGRWCITVADDSDQTKALVNQWDGEVLK